MNKKCIICSIGCTITADLLCKQVKVKLMMMWRPNSQKGQLKRGYSAQQAESAGILKGRNRENKENLLAYTWQYVGWWTTPSSKVIMGKYTDRGAVSLAELENGTWSRNFQYIGARYHQHHVYLLACKNKPYLWWLAHVLIKQTLHPYDQTL